MPLTQADQARRMAELESAKRIVTRCKSDGRDRLTNSERDQIQAHMAKAKEILDNAPAEDDSALFRAVGEAISGKSSPDNGLGQRLKLKSSATADAIAAKMAASGTAYGAKALMPAGSVHTGITLSPATVVPLGTVVPGLLPFIPTTNAGPDFSYLFQTLRTNNAAPVADGALKPTTLLEMDLAQARLRTIAHISEGIPKYWLEDNANLRNFVSMEMLNGLEEELESQILTGSGVGENLTGIGTVSGTQTQAFVDNPSRTLRAAQTKLEIVGAESIVFAVHPSDLETIDVLRADAGGTTGPYLHMAAQFGASQTAPGETLWQGTIARSVAVPVGTAYAFDPAALLLYTDGGVTTDWSEAYSDDFAKNLVRARVEGRFFLATLQPNKVVEVDLTAA